MIHSYSNKPMYDLLYLINDVEKKVATKGVCTLCGGPAADNFHLSHCELDKMRKIIKSLECGDD